MERINLSSSDKEIKNKSHEIIEKEQWYLLELDEEGNVSIENDKSMTIPRNCYLKIRFFNGSKISQATKLITNAYDRNLTLDKVKNEEYLDRINKVEPTAIDSHIHFDLYLKNSGPTFFLFSYQDEENLELIRYTKEFYILVEPTIQLGKNVINLDSMHMQTVLSKSLGKMKDWDYFYQEVHSLKYNFIHFTPLQKLGWSDSLYCINDNNEINGIFFDEDYLQPEEKLKILNNTIDEMRNKYHVGGIIDIVLNHASSNSEWLHKNPESGYNLINFPHLNAAYNLEVILLNYSQRYSEKKVTCSAAPYINNENDLKELINELSREIYKNNLEEFFLIAVDKYIPEFQKTYAEYKEDFNTYLTKRNYLARKLRDIQENINNKLDDKKIFELIYESCSNYGAERFGVEINAEFVTILVLNSMKDNPSENEFLKQLKIYLNKVNEIWYKKSKEFIGVAIDNIRSYIKYEFLDLKRFKVTSHKRIVENYFTSFDENKKDSIFACNGWLFGVNDPTINFALYGNWHYFTRSIVIWGDCAKLNYGDKPEDSPYLWHHMTKYVQDMARIFNGFRLDNAHSTPIHVAEYLMKKAREVNEDLVIIAELFAGTKEREINFVNRIGINHLIREAIYCTDAQQLGEKIHHFGGGYEHILGKLDNNIREYRLVEIGGTKKFKNISYKYLSSAKPRSLMYDITHDNPTYYEKFNNLGLNLTFLAAIGMCCTSVGTTRGFDQLYPYQPSVVRENRLYLIDQDFKNVLTNLEEEYEEEEKKEKNNNRLEHTFEFNLSPHMRTNTVRLALSSHNWKPDINLKKVNDKQFTVTLSLTKDIYYYKYVLDNNIWVYDPNAETVKDASGNINNTLNLKQHSKFVVPDLKIVRREINKIRNDLIGKQGNQIFIHQDRDLVCIFRMFTDLNSDYDGYVLICRTGFDKQNNMMKAKVELPGEISEFLFSANIYIPKFDINIIRSDYKLLGVRSDLHFSRDMNFLSSIANISKINNKDVIDFHSLLPNTVIALKIKFPQIVKNSMKKIYQSLDYLNENGEDLIEKFDLCDINHALYKCEKEELDNTSNKRGNYEIMNYGKLVYAGITHLIQVIVNLKKNQALDNPVFNNIREGDWLIEYEFDRLKEPETFKALHSFLYENITKNFKVLVNYLKPHFFCLIFDSLYDVLVRKILNSVLFNYSVQKKEIYYETFLQAEFVQNLLIANTEFTGFVESAKFGTRDILSISAGLPHFSTEYMRCWGRDTFIAFKGVLLVPGYYDEARVIIKQFASSMRHGLIPNLLDCGNNPRYNARDATWFFLQAIKEYLILSSDYAFLNEELDMLFLDDDINSHYNLIKQGRKKRLKLYDVIQHIIESHTKGIEFREWRAGKAIDEHMKDEGFNVKIYLDKSTGFIYGGNKFNCGTWMDKMGSSEKARNKGNPATPRDGADVEIQGLLYSILSFLNNLNIKNLYPYSSAKLKDGSNLYFVKWIFLLEDNFEKHFFLSSNPSENNSNKCNFYKDYISHSGEVNLYNNYQLRPNYLIAMAVAPNLFSTDKAMKAILNAEKYLLVPNGLGIRTLDLGDKFYNGDYINSDDSNNYQTAHGFNYHNGPEWLWPIGYYLMTKLNFNSFSDMRSLSKYIFSILIPHIKYIREDKWKGLPELMNKDNSYCPGSCNTQAWSIATILEALYEMNKKIWDNTNFKEGN